MVRTRLEIIRFIFGMRVNLARSMGQGTAAILSFDKLAVGNCIEIKWADATGGEVKVGEAC